jgi:hypothetical protein
MKEKSLMSKDNWSDLKCQANHSLEQALHTLLCRSIQALCYQEIYYAILR